MRKTDIFETKGIKGQKEYILSEERMGKIIWVKKGGKKVDYYIANGQYTDLYGYKSLFLKQTPKRKAKIEVRCYLDNQ